MSNLKSEILIELTLAEIEKYIEFYANSKQLENVYVSMYLKNQMNWNRKIEAMSDVEKYQLNDRCRQKFYRYKSGKPESYTLIGLTGEKVIILKLLLIEFSFNYYFHISGLLFIHSLIG